MSMAIHLQRPSRFPAGLGTCRTAFAGLVLAASGAMAAKTVYVPQFLANDGIDLNDANAKFSYSRSVETDNWIIFWEPGFGKDPSTASGTYKVDMNALKTVVEKSYAEYVDSLKMVVKGSSLTDKYKMEVFLLYQTDWAAYGSGQDEKIGTLHVDPAAANIATVVAHEIGHCFEYMTGADVPGAGWRWGFKSDGSTGNGFWEQIAQWEAFRTYPDQEFTNTDYPEYLTSNHKHIIHETPRYANYFIGDYWAYKHGIDFMGKLWRATKSPEDPVQTYMRMNSITIDSFDNEMYEHASRLTTWDLPAIKSRGASHIGDRPQVKMSQTSDKYWLVDPTVAPENTGYNSIKLNAPTTQTTIQVKFQGKAGASGFRSLNVDKGGWRYGFVALLKDGTRVYSEMATAKYSNGANPSGSLNFTVPANCDKLWLVVTGAPQTYWPHVWDDNDANDEQWPYQIQLANTNLLGETNPPAVVIPPTTGIQDGAKADDRSFQVHDGILELVGGGQSAEIFDVHGNLVRSIGFGHAGKTIALGDLPKGLLVVRAKSAGSESYRTGTLANLPRNR